MIIDCISDLHGYYPALEGGDLLIVAGDVTNNDYECPFSLWLEEQNYEKIIWIAGNHDNIWYKSWLEHGEKRRPKMKEGKWKGPERNDKIEYLCDNGTIFKGLKVWGSPWSKSFPGINPKCRAFVVDTEEELAKKWAKIPEDTDILITHSPAYGFGDEAIRRNNGMIYEEHVGSESLLKWISSHSKTLKMHVCGHVHEGYRVWDVRTAKAMCNDPNPSPILINASHVNERYQPVNKPIRIEL